MKLIDVVGAIIITMMMVPGLARIWSQATLEIEKRQVADHLAAVNRAAASYVRKHQTTLLAQATATSGPVITVADMVNDGLLPQGFQNRNAWRQEYSVYIRKPKENNIQAVVMTTGGRGHDRDKDVGFATAVVPAAALQLGGAGGYVPTGDIPGQSSATLHGAGGGWVLALDSVGIPSPGAGHLGALSNFDPTSLGQDQLYRIAVPGHPELNQMQTEIDMTDHAIRHISEVQFTERTITNEACTTPEEQGRMFLDREQGLYLCRNNSLEMIADSGNSTLLKTMTLAQNGDIINKPLCPPSTNTMPTIYTSPTLAEAGPKAPPIHAFQTWATSLNDTEWKVNLRLLSTDKSLSSDGTEWVYPEANYARILVHTACTKEAKP